LTVLYRQESLNQPGRLEVYQVAVSKQSRSQQKWLGYKLNDRGIVVRFSAGERVDKTSGQVLFCYLVDTKAVSLEVLPPPFISSLLSFPKQERGGLVNSP
jgi:hypothetical protein